VAVIYGEPGIGKTSLSFTAENPVLEDFDGGLKRAIGRKTALEFDSWEDAVEFHRSPEFEKLNPTTLIIDTAGTMLDNYMAMACIKEDGKNSKQSGQLSLQGYGALKSTFQAFIADIKLKKIDLIFIAHQSQQKEGDSFRYVPKMTGGSFDILIAISDMVGYMQSTNNKRTIDFRPIDRHYGKDTAGLGSLVIPDFTHPDYATYMANMIDLTKKKMLDVNQAQQEALKKLTTYRKEIGDAKTVDDLDILYPAIEIMSKSYQVQLMSLYDPKYLQLWELEIVKGCTSVTNANSYLEAISSVPKKFIPKLKTILWESAKENGLGFDKKLMIFTAAEPVKDEKVAETTADGSVQASKPNGELFPEKSKKPADEKAGN